MTSGDDSSFSVIDAIKQGRYFPKPSVMRERLLVKRTVFIDEPIDDELTRDVAMRLLALDSHNPELPIHLVVDCEGGKAVNTFAIVLCMKELTAPIHTWCSTKARGIAALIVASGEVGHRHIDSRAAILLANPKTDSPKWWQPLKNMRSLRRTRKNMATDLAACSNQSVDQIKQLMNKSTLLQAGDAKQLGIVDHVVDHSPLDVLDEENIKATEA